MGVAVDGAQGPARARPPAAVQGAPRAPRGRPWPAWVDYRPRQVWGYDLTTFAAAGTQALAILDLVSRKWIDTMLCPEASSVQVQALFVRALDAEGLLDEIVARVDNDDDRADTQPILLAV